MYQGRKTTSLPKVTARPETQCFEAPQTQALLLEQEPGVPSIHESGCYARHDNSVLYRKRAGIEYAREDCRFQYQSLSLMLHQSTASAHLSAAQIPDQEHADAQPISCKSSDSYLCNDCRRQRVIEKLLKTETTFSRTNRRSSSLELKSDTADGSLADAHPRSTSRPQPAPLPAVVAFVDEEAQVYECLALKQKLKPALRRSPGSRDNPILLFADGQRPGLRDRRRIQKQLRTRKVVQKVQFADAAQVQEFDHEMTPEHTTCIGVIEHVVTDRVSELRSLSKLALKHRRKGDGVEVRFRKTGANGVKHEFLPGLKMSDRDTVNIVNLLQNMIKHHGSHFEDLPHAPAFIRFRLMEEPERSDELHDVDDFTSIGELRKWMILDTRDEWAVDHLSHEYSRFLSVCRMAREARREEAHRQPRGPSWLWRRAFRKAESGHEIRTRLKAHRLHAVVELLWE